MTFLHCLFILSHPARSMSLSRAFSCLAACVGQGLIGLLVETVHFYKQLSTARQNEFI